MKLSLRLEQVASFVPEGSFLADCGSDHAYLPLSCLEAHRIVGAQAIENKKGPYLRMKENLDASPYGNHVESSLSDGISSLSPQADCLVLAGMGGSLICRILLAHPENLTHVSSIILNPHRDLKKVRETLVGLGYFLEDEAMVEEDGIYDVVIFCQKGEAPAPYSEEELEYGPILLKKLDPVFLDFVQKEASRLEALLQEDLSPKTREEYQRKIAFLKGIRDRKAS